MYHRLLYFFTRSKPLLPNEFQEKDNQTLVYLKTKEKPDGQSVRELKKNGTVFYYPENKTAEIVYDDGEIFKDTLLPFLASYF